jgi:hypothetical protein
VLTDWAEEHVGRIVAARDEFEAQGA